MRERIVRALQFHKLTGFDTSVFVYHVERSVSYAPLTSLVLDSVAAGSFAAVTSILTLMELTVQPLQRGRRDLAEQYEIFVTEHPNLTVAPIDTVMVRTAAELRAAYRLRAIDALHVAACLEAGASAFLTNDRDLPRVRELQVLLLDDFVVN